MNPITSLPVPPSCMRLAEVDRAIRFLRVRGILVTVCNRDAQIRRYRVTGKRDPMLLDDVVAHAITHGMATGAEAPHG